MVDYVEADKSAVACGAEAFPENPICGQIFTRPDLGKAYMYIVDKWVQISGTISQQFGGPLVSATAPGGGATYIVCRAYFPGSTKVGIPTKIYVGSYISSGSYTITIHDMTNDAQIAEVTGQSNTSMALIDMGTLSNIPEGQAIFQIRMTFAGVTGYNAGGLIEW